jgi:cobalt-zinc-cadmium efflux system outer membrane protein
LLAAQRVARLDLVQLEVELERYRAEARAVERELPAAYQRLAAMLGDPRLPIGRLIGPFDTPPKYELDTTREAVLAYHPHVRSARVGVERAQAAVRLAEVQPIPNVTLTGGYVQQFENRSNDAMFAISAPIPTWNRNQGNIRAAQAELGMAIQNVGRVENELTERLATNFRTYTAARERADRYQTQIIPRAEETYKLSMEAFKGGQFEYLRVIQAQRAVAEARLELNRSLGEAWKAAGELSGLLLEEAWPGPPPGPAAGPVRIPARPTGSPNPR